MNPYRVPILREIDDGANDRDPDHIRGAKLANVLFDTSYGQGDVVEVVYLDHVASDYLATVEQRDEIASDPQYRMFRQELQEGRAVISIEDTARLPAGFDRDPDQSPEAFQ